MPPDPPRSSEALRPTSPVLGGATTEGLGRPPWAVGALLEHYYDTEWGMPVRDEREMFERITLETFQSGLSWATVLAKREAFRDAFHHFDPGRVARFTAVDVERLVGRADIIRNRRKIEAAITNARATIALRADGGLVALVWSFKPATTPAPRRVEDIPSTSSESTALAQELRRRGFTLVGPTTMFALLQAVGIVDTHLLRSPRRGSSGVWPAT